MCRFSVIASLLLAVVGCGHDRPSAPVSVPAHWIPTDTLASVALLQIDYQTLRFEGAVVRQFLQREPAGDDSIPFTLRERPATDVGWTLITYTETGDTLFFGYTVWSGHGHRVVPSQLVPADSFALAVDSLRAPQEVTCLAPPGDAPTWCAAADSAWAVARHLDVTEEFARRPYRVGLFLYRGAVGDFDPTAADWMVFLYAPRR